MNYRRKLWVVAFVIIAQSYAQASCHVHVKMTFLGHTSFFANRFQGLFGVVAPTPSGQPLILQATPTTPDADGYLPYSNCPTSGSLDVTVGGSIDFYNGSSLVFVKSCPNKPVTLFPNEDTTVSYFFTEDSVESPPMTPFPAYNCN